MATASLRLYLFAGRSADRPDHTHRGLARLSLFSPSLEGEANVYVEALIADFGHPGWVQGGIGRVWVRCTNQNLSLMRMI
jgi:hypothetical protein